MDWDESVPHVATLLGIDPIKEPQYLWIAKMAARAVLDPTEWQEFTNEKGKTQYFNLKLKVRPHLIIRHFIDLENTKPPSSDIHVLKSIPPQEGLLRKCPS